MLLEEFLKPLGLTQGGLAEAMGVQRRLVSEICNNSPGRYGGYCSDAGPRLRQLA